jgi:hypothetical protein
MATSEDILTQVKTLASDIKFAPGETFSWSPVKRTVYYDASALDQVTGEWALIHETAHALLGHTNYSDDFNLLTMEVAAWDKAKEIAHTFGATIDEEHIQDCLDTYRDWLHRRSTCPTCGCVSLQYDARNYACYNCNTRWLVSTARFCRPYRKTAKSLKK